MTAVFEPPVGEDHKKSIGFGLILLTASVILTGITFVSTVRGVNVTQGPLSELGKDYVQAVTCIGLSMTLALASTLTCLVWLARSRRSNSAIWWAQLFLVAAVILAVIAATRLSWRPP
jgi:hypothetical protein